MQDVEIKRGIMDRIAWKQEEFVDKGGKEDTCPTRQQEALLEKLAHVAGCEMIMYKNPIVGDERQLLPHPDATRG